ncbi:sigma-54-dependent transcriptional regulator [Candidatus Omnitrophota bacterium]
MSGKILVVDDDELIRKSMYEVLKMIGYEVDTAENGVDAFDFLKENICDIVITDLKMPGLDGIGLLKRIRENFQDIAVIIATSYGSIDTAVDAMRFGAADYITKPIIDEEIKLVIKDILARKQIRQENEYLRRELTEKRERFQKLYGQDKQMQRIYSLVESVANTKATVLIHGDSGTGKGLVAHAVYNSDVARKNKPFVEVSCGALPATLLESELFGHVKGAFTSAIKDRMGRFELANGGTIFLDEIDTLSPLLQVKLLRVLQDMEFERVGDTKTLKVDVRIIAATNQDLEELIKKGLFREDLYYRLNVIKIEMPLLKERKGDIPLLCDHFLKEFNKKFGKNVAEIREDFLKRIMAYSWPGNVRELENMIERAVVLCKESYLSENDLPDNLLSEESVTGVPSADGEGVVFNSLKEALRDPEKNVIREVLERTNWNRKETAKILDINRTTLYNKMREYDLLNN